MKKFIIILSAVVVIINICIIGCNSGKGRSQNREGISEMPSSVSKDASLNKR
jgi:hypothetical protein